jgi:hypothetical protein
MTTEFTSGPDWECSSGPITTRDFDASADLWPHGAGSEIGGGDKDVLADGLHPVLAVGLRAQRPINLTGVVISYNSANDRAQVNLGEKVCVKQWVANVTSYSGTVPLTFDTTVDIGRPVYVDDSDSLAAGVTLSMSPLNNVGSANPLAGYVFYCQDDYVDTGVGGAGANVSYPRTVANSLVQQEYCVMLTNVYGYGAADPTP